MSSYSNPRRFAGRGSPGHRSPSIPPAFRWCRKQSCASADALYVMATFESGLISGGSDMYFPRSSSPGSLGAFRRVRLLHDHRQRFFQFLPGDRAGWIIHLCPLELCRRALQIPVISLLQSLFYMLLSRFEPRLVEPDFVSCVVGIGLQGFLIKLQCGVVVLESSPPSALCYNLSGPSGSPRRRHPSRHTE